MGEVILGILVIKTVGYSEMASAIIVRGDIVFPCFLHLIMYAVGVTIATCITNLASFKY